MKSKWHSELPSNWDELVSSFDNSTIFHSRDWLKHIEDQSISYSVKAISIFSNKELVSIVPYVELRKALFIKIFASPLGGTGTNYLGPLFNEETINIQELLVYLTREIRKKGYKHIEINSQSISQETFESLGFRSHKYVSNIIDLPDTEEEAWSKLKSSCRNRVRKSEKKGCTLELVSDDMLPLQFHERLSAVYERQGLKNPLTVERTKSLYTRVHNILPARVIVDGKVVAAGIFPYDEHCIYFWGGAAFPEDYKYYPNEFLQWAVIKYAVKNGIKRYNMCGGQSQFKDKFGGRDMPYLTYSMSFLPFLSKARSLYRKLHFLQIKVKGMLTS